MSFLNMIPQPKETENEDAPKLVFTLDAEPSQLKQYYDIFKENEGQFTQDSEQFNTVKNIFKEIVVFRDIPNQFKLEISNAIEPIQYKAFDTIIDMKEKQYIYILLEGEAQIMAQEKQVPLLKQSLLKKVKLAKLLLQQQQQQEEVAAEEKPENNLMSKMSKKISNMVQNQPPQEEVPLQQLIDQKVKGLEDVKIVQEGECFGQYYNLTGNKWRPSIVMATKQNTLAIRILASKIDNVLNKINSSEHHKQLIQFLGDCIGSFNVVSAVARDKIARSFTPKQFYPGMKLISEGEQSNSAFIIKEGDCMIVSGKNPALTDLLANRNPENKDKISKDQMKSGYMSKSTNIFQLGVKGPKQWIGEDVLILQPGQPFYFSVIAQTRVVAMEISKADMLLKLPAQFVKHLERSSLKRREWVFARMLNIQQTVKQVIKKVEDMDQFETEKEKSLFKQKKTQFIENQLRLLTYQSQKKQEQEIIEQLSNSVEVNPNRSNIKVEGHLGSQSISKERKKTINLRVKKDLLIQFPKKNDELVSLKLPEIPQNPRDRQMMKNFSRKSITMNQSPKGDYEEDGESLGLLQSKRVQQSINQYTPHKKKISLYQKEQISYRNNESVEVMETKSMYHSLIKGKDSQADLSMYEGNGATLSVYEPSKLSTYGNYTRKVGLLNAQTIKPYSLVRRRELIPVFYQKGQQKTKNLLLQNGSVDDRSRESLDMGQGFQLNIGSIQEINSQVNFPNELDTRSQIHQSIPVDTHRKTISSPQYNLPQPKAIEPSLFNFQVKDSSTPIKKVNRVNKKILKDVKKQFNSFVIARRKIQELDGNIVEKINNNGMAQGYSINERKDSRQETPNPWNEHEERQRRRENQLSQLKLMNMQEEQNTYRSQESVYQE